MSLVKSENMQGIRLKSPKRKRSAIPEARGLKILAISEKVKSKMLVTYKGSHLIVRFDQSSMSS